MIDMKEIDIDLIKPYKNNPREISAEAVQKVMKSIKEFGYNSPIVVDKDHVILAGHTRWKAMKQLGKKKANIIVRDLTKEQAVAYRIMDNRSGEESKWQNKLLAEELNVLQDSTFDLDLTGFNATELENLANDKELGFIQNAKDLELSHLAIDEKEDNPKYLNHIFKNELEYPFLVKEFDSKDLGYQYHMKIFRVNYEILDKTNENKK